MLSIYVADSQAENLRVSLLVLECRTRTLDLPNRRAALFRGTLARGGNMKLFFFAVEERLIKVNFSMAENVTVQRSPR